MKICEVFAPNFGVKKIVVTSRQRTLSHFLFHKGFKNNTTVVPIHPTSLLLRLKIKLKGHHFDTVQLIEAESLAVLNTLTDDFQDAF
jgi:hypothetical protein